MDDGGWDGRKDGWKMIGRRRRDREGTKERRDRN